MKRKRITQNQNHNNIRYFIMQHSTKVIMFSLIEMRYDRNQNKNMTSFAVLIRSELIDSEMLCDILATKSI